MRLFKKKKEGEELFEGQGSSVDSDTPVEEEPTVAGAAGPEGAEPEPDDEEAAAAPAPAHPGRGFFDLAPDEVAGYHAPATLMVPRRRIPWKPIAKVVGILAALGLVAALVVLLWPSPGGGLPDYVGKTVTEAMESARGLGYHPEVSRWEYSHKHSDGVVLEQSPAPGKGVAPGTQVALVVSKGARPEAEPTVTVDTGAANGSTPPVNPFAAKVVLIDPGHQSLPAENEWSDPDMTRRVPGEPSLRGISTGNLEDRVALDIATKLNTLLGKDGVTVVMTRDKGDIDLPETTRAEMANDSKANLFIRIHMAGSKDPMMSGVVTLYPAKTKYTKDFYEKSKAAALLIQQELVKATGATDYGVEDRHDHVAFNWSHVPVVESEVGYLTSPADDLSLDDDAYRWKVAQGLRNGVIKFLQSK